MVDINDAAQHHHQTSLISQGSSRKNTTVFHCQAAEENLFLPIDPVVRGEISRQTSTLLSQEVADIKIGGGLRAVDDKDPAVEVHHEGLHTWSALSKNQK